MEFLEITIVVALDMDDVAEISKLKVGMAGYKGHNLASLDVVVAPTIPLVVSPNWLR